MLDNFKSALRQLLEESTAMRRTLTLSLPGAEHCEDQRPQNSLGP